jgi:hypothetical protein
LIVGRYSGVAVFHYLIVGQTFGARKPAFYAGFEIVPKLTLYGTLGAFPDFDDWALTAESAD